MIADSHKKIILLCWFIYRWPDFKKAVYFFV